MISCWTRAYIWGLCRALLRIFGTVLNLVAYWQGGFMCALWCWLRMWLNAGNRLWSMWVPNGLKRVKDLQIIHFCDDATITQLAKWQFCQLFRNASKSLIAVRSSSHSADTLVWSRFKRKSKREDAVLSVIINHSHSFQMIDLIW